MVILRRYSILGASQLDTGRQQGVGCGVGSIALINEG